MKSTTVDSQFTGVSDARSNHIFVLLLTGAKVSHYSQNLGTSNISIFTRYNYSFRKEGTYTPRDDYIQQHQYPQPKPSSLVYTVYHNTRFLRLLCGLRSRNVKFTSGDSHLLLTNISSVELSKLESWYFCSHRPGGRCRPNLYSGMRGCVKGGMNVMVLAPARK